MGAETYKGGPGWIEPKIAKEWVELLNKPRVMKRTPGVDEDTPPNVKMVVRRRGMSCFIQNLPPGGHSVNHGHTQGAVFYILQGKGYEIHDGVRYNWEAGDAAILHDGGIVHQHFNADPERLAKMLVFTYPRAYDGQNLVAGGRIEPPGGATEDLSLGRRIFREGGTDDV